MDGATKTSCKSTRSTRVFAPFNVSTQTTPTPSKLTHVPISSQRSTSSISSSFANDIVVEINDPIHSQSTPNYKVSNSKRKRGPTRNIALSRKRKTNEKLSIEVSDESGRIIGKDAQSCITEAGCVVRKHATFQVSKWSNLSSTEKENLFKVVKDSLGIEEQDTIKRAIFKQLNSQYRNTKHKLYKYHFKIHPTKEEAIRNRPEGVKEEDWLWLCDHFSSDEYKKLSMRNKVNRAKQDTPHTAGTKSFKRMRNEKEREGNKIGQIQLYNMTHFSEKKNEWVREQAKENFEKMKNLQDDAGEESVDPMVEEQICASVLGQKSGYVRGCGPGPKPNGLVKHKHHPQLQEARKRAEHAEQRAEYAEEKIGELQDEIQKMKENQEKTNQLLKENQEKTNQLLAQLLAKQS